MCLQNVTAGLIEYRMRYTSKFHKVLLHHAAEMEFENTKGLQGLLLATQQ